MECEEHLHAGLVLCLGKSSTDPQGVGHCVRTTKLSQLCPRKHCGLKLSYEETLSSDKTTVKPHLLLGGIFLHFPNQPLFSKLFSEDKIFTGVLTGSTHRWLEVHHLLFTYGEQKAPRLLEESDKFTEVNISTRVPSQSLIYKSV